MTKYTMRILHVIASLSPVRGGTTSAVLQMIAGLKSHGVVSEVVASDDDGPARRLAGDAPERSIPGRHYFPKRSDFYIYTLGIGPWLHANVRAYDLIHIHGLFTHVAGLAGRICRYQGVPYVVTPHGMATRHSMRHKPLRKALSFFLIERPLLEGATTVHMTSRGEQRDFAELKISTPATRVPLAVEPVPSGDATAFRACHPEVGDRRIAVFLGRLNPIKNLEAAIDALSLAGGADVHLVVCGEGPDSYARVLKARCHIPHDYTAVS